MNNRKIVLALAAIFVAASAEASDFNLTVIDGDTLRQDKDRLRLLHIDAPETLQCSSQFGQDFSAILKLD